jgi:hypothetical protein
LISTGELQLTSIDRVNAGQFRGGAHRGGGVAGRCGKFTAVLQQHVPCGRIVRVGHTLVDHFCRDLRTLGEGRNGVVPEHVADQFFSFGGGGCIGDGNPGMRRRGFSNRGGDKQDEQSAEQS